MRRLLSILAAGAIYGCVVAAQESIPRDWIEVAVGPVFTLRAPPGTTFNALQGIDSFTGFLKGPGFGLSVDFGAVSRSAIPVPPGSSTENFQIDKKPAVLVFRQPALEPDLHGGYSVRLRVTEIGPAGENSSRLTLTGRVDQPADIQVIRRMFTTIRFR